MKGFPEVKFEKAYIQKGNVGLFQVLFPAKGFTTFGVFDFGAKSKPMAGLFKNGIGEWAFEEDYFHFLAEKYAEKLQQKKPFEERYEKWMKVCNKIHAFALKINGDNLGALSEQQIKELFKKLSEMIEEFWNYSVFIDMFDAGYDMQDIERTNRQFGFSKGEIQLLLTPTKTSYVQENKLLLFGLAEKYSKEKAAGFIRKFFWIKTDYAETGRFGEKELLKELAELKKTDWKKEMQELLDYSKELERQQAEILKQKKLKENPFWFYNELTFWRDERKRYNYTSIFAATQLALELLKRKGMEKYLKVLTHDELFAVPEKQELEKRMKNGIIFAMSDEQTAIYAESDVEKRFQEMVGAQEAKGDLRGMGASIGTATGKAKIIMTPKEFGKMQQGDILVTSTTRPEFVPIMRKAAAIVTDEGGITSHAAIVSRELGIPCIVGTKIATKVLKDNDLIEVKAGHGLVRKISSGEKA